MPLSGKPQGIDRERQRDPQAIAGEQTDEEGLKTAVSRNTAEVQYKQFESPNNKN